MPTLNRQLRSIIRKIGYDPRERVKYIGPDNVVHLSEKEKAILDDIWEELFKSKGDPDFSKYGYINALKVIQRKKNK